MIRARRRDLLAWLAAPLAAWPFAAHTQQPAPGDALKEQLVGSWELVSITMQYQQSLGEQQDSETIPDPVQPYGPNLRGLLSFERNGRFASTVLNSDGTKAASTHPDAPAEFESASGTYSMHPFRERTLIFDFGPPSGQRRFQERWAEITTVTAKELEFTATLTKPGGGWESLFVYSKAG